MSQVQQNPNFVLLNIGYSELNANWNWKNIYSPFARIYCVKDGEARTTINGKSYVLKPNHLYLTPPFSLHDDECDSYFSLFYIHFYERGINQESIFDKYYFPVEIEASGLDFLLTEKLLKSNPDRYLKHIDPQLYDNVPTFNQYTAYNNKTPYHSIIETQGILCQLMSGFMKNMEPKSTDMDLRINKALQYIHQNIDSDITISYLASMACLTEDHFIRLFKKETDQTPLRYINSKKIEKAQTLLTTSDMPIQSIALELSIDNISYFNRLFKQYTGKTPSLYRKDIYSI